MPNAIEVNGCDDASGVLPGCAPLAVPFVPYQQTSPKRYSKFESLSEGTLFPGLNLPFHVKKNGRRIASTPETELQALAFIIQELTLYLDTHPTDSEAFALFQNYAKLLEQGKQTYVEKVGPLTAVDAAMDDSYTWVLGPWPWQNEDKEG